MQNDNLTQTLEFLAGVDLKKKKINSCFRKLNKFMLLIIYVNLSFKASWIHFCNFKGNICVYVAFETNDVVHANWQNGTDFIPISKSLVLVGQKG